MAEEVARQIQGLKIGRYFTTEKSDPYGEVVFEKRTSTIRNPDGSVVAEINDVEVPASWSQVATDILAQKYFRKAGVPLYDEQGGPLLDASGSQVLGSEKSVKQVINRLVGCWRHWGEKYGYFASKEDADSFEQEMRFMLLHQYAAPNSPQWFNTGLNWAYGITGPSQGHCYVDPDSKELVYSKDAYSHPAPHACFILSVKDDLVNEGGIFDLLTREARVFKYGAGVGSDFSSLRANGEKLSGGGKSSGVMSFLKIYDRAAGAVKSGGTTRRAAKMVVMNISHPDVEEFIGWKAKEEQKVVALVAGSKIASKYLSQVVEISKEEKTTRFEKNARLAKAVKEAVKAKIPANYVSRVLKLVEEGREVPDFPVFDTHYESEAYVTVSGQNSNNSVRVSNEFMKAVMQNSDWNLTYRTSGKIAKTVKATDLWNKIKY